MIELISRQAAIKTAFTMRCRCDTNDIDDYANMMLCALNILPTVEPKKAKWIIRKDALGRTYSLCSNCKTDFAIRDTMGRWLHFDVLQMKYCPNCGARVNEDIKDSE